jgi:hypothetical protein
VETVLLVLVVVVKDLLLARELLVPLGRETTEETELAVMVVVVVVLAPLALE